MSEVDQNTVYATPETRSRLGWIGDRMGAWTDRPTVVIAPEDSNGGDQGTVQRLLESAKGFPANRYQEEDIQTISRNLQTRSGSATSVPGGAVVTTLPLDSTVPQMASRASGVPQSALENLPGTAQEWHAFTLMHEAGHIPQDRPGPGYAERLDSESGADRFAIQTYERERAAGNVSTPQVPQAQMAMRAIGAWTGHLEFSHSTGAMVQSPNEHEHPPAGTSREFADQLHAARQSVWKEMGADQVSEEDKRKAIRELVRKGDMPPTAGTIEEITAGMTPEQKQKYDKKIDSVAQRYGIKLADEQPELLYETTRRQYAQGKFDDNPIGKQYAWEYLEASRQYAPNHFGVDPGQAPTPEPQRGAPAGPAAQPYMSPTPAQRSTYIPAP